ncbi:MAG: hypothetical protein HY744_19435 [Deltaproteobacteria bacterium]|nr:hypothetical protein [Deltaproteobacteria bacterium]
MQAPMLRPRRAAAAATAALLTLLAGCDRGATGIDACRRIEQARCRAVAGCPQFESWADDDAEECELFYHDQCLFGVADGLSPDEPSLDACLAAIAQAVACKGGTDVSTCTEAPELAPDAPGSTTACELIRAPEQLAACGFLRPPASPALADAGGGDGGPADAGGAAGQ